jgi:methylenetetrahydrofolate dehydrogenase (NADP+)/methenyltetrahydrofolate cyclohydrolase
MAVLLKGAEVAAALNEKIRDDVTGLKQSGINPALSIIRVGDREDDVYYEKSIIKSCLSSGVITKQYHLDHNVTQESLMNTIRELNADAENTGAHH